jgi:hypothetical protein
MEGESHFLTLLPRDVRHKVHGSWYQEQNQHMTDFLNRNVKPFDQPTGVFYRTEDYKSELYDIIKISLSPVLSNRYDIINTGLKPENESLLQTIESIKGFSNDTLPQITMLMIESNQGKNQLYTLLRNNAHKNISSLFNEDDTRIPDKDDLTIVRGVIGSYPAAFLQLQEEDIAEFVQRLRDMSNEEDYRQLLDRFAIRRSSSQFWPFSDTLHNWYKSDQPVEFGMLDYNRFENR